MRTVFALSAAEKIDARAALQMLAGTGITLEQAAALATAGRRAREQITVEAAFDRFLRGKMQAGELRQATLHFYGVKTAPFIGVFGTRPMDTVTRKEVRAWHDSLPASATSKAMQIRALKALWRWAVACEPSLAAEDVTLGLPTQVKRNGEIGFLGVDDCGAIMHSLPEAYRPTLALMLFAGLRPDEVRSADKPPLLWRHVNTADHIVRVPAEIAKTGVARLIEGLPPTLWRWLRHPGGPDTPICPALSGHAVRLARELSGHGPAKPWPHDALRHTFATYHMAGFANPGLTATLLGHEGAPAMLHRHYRGLATKGEAARFWGLRP